MTAQDHYESEHLRTRRSVWSFADSLYGEMTEYGPAPKLSETPGRVRWVARPVGFHNEYVFRKLLGLSTSQMDAWGIGYRQLRKINPRLIYVACSTYGQFGPEAERQANKPDYEVADQALSGIVHVTGEMQSGDDPQPSEVPTKAGNWFGWYAAGAWGAFATLTALYHPELQTDPRFKTFIDRLQVESKKVLHSIVETWSQNYTSDEILGMVQDYVVNKRGPGIVATGRVNSPGQTLGEDHWWQRGAFERVEDPVYGELAVQGTPWKMTETPPRTKWLCRPVGADNEYVYLKYLGYDRGRLEDLTEQGVI